MHQDKEWEKKLMQEGEPLAFESKQFKGKDLVKSTYEKEMAKNFHAIKKW
jgi:hypothetical protein